MHSSPWQATGHSAKGFVNDQAFAIKKKIKYLHLAIGGGRVTRGQMN
jgi:hypothetical protein